MMVRLVRSMSSQRRSQASENPKAVPVDQEADQPVAVAIPIPL
jgi:hypothetical protein